MFVDLLLRHFLSVVFPLFLTCLNVFTAECTFDYFLGSGSSTCNWQQDHSGADNFDWKRASGATPSVQTGPSFDHTYGTKQGKHSFEMIEKFKFAPLLNTLMYQTR